MHVFAAASADTGTEWLEVATALGTMGAVAAALIATVVSVRTQRRTLRAEGRREAALAIAVWAHEAQRGIEAWHSPRNWAAPPGRPADEIVPPSQGRMAPSVERAIAEFESIRGRARLAFGVDDEVTHLVADTIEAIQRVADHGLITAAEVFTPQNYVVRTFRPIVADLVEALAEACELREVNGERNEVRPDANLPRESP